MAAGAPPEAVERLLGAVELTAGGAFPAAAVGRPQPTSGRGLLATRLLPHATPQLRPGFPCPPPQVPHNIGQVLAAMGPDAVGEEVWTYWGAPYREQPCWAAVSLSCSGLCLARWPSSSDLWDFCSLRTVARFLLKAPDTMPPSRPLTRPPTATRCGRMGWWSRRAWLGRPAHRCAWRRPAAAAWQPPSWRTGGGWRRHRPHHCQLWRRQHRRLQQGQCRTRRASAMTCDSPCPQASAPRLRIPQRRPPVQTTALRPLDAATASTGSWQSIWWQRVLVAWAAALVRGAHCATRQSTAGPLAMCGAQGAAAWQKRWRRGTRPRCPCSGQPGSWSRRCWPTACQRTSARCRRRPRCRRSPGGPGPGQPGRALRNPKGSCARRLRGGVHGSRAAAGARLGAAVVPREPGQPLLFGDEPHRIKRVALPLWSQLCSAGERRTALALLLFCRGCAVFDDAGEPLARSFASVQGPGREGVEGRACWLCLPHA